MEVVNPTFIQKDDTVDIKGALTTITPDLVASDDAAHQLSDDAAAHQPQDTSDDAPDAPSNPIESMPVSPFANATAPIGEEQTDSVGFLNDELLADGSRQHHLLRHSLPSELRGTGVLSHFGVDTVSEASKIIKKMSQRDLQAKFKAVYGTKTFSNNNNWLRRKLFEAIGLDPSKGATKKPGAGTQRRRRSNNAGKAANGVLKPIVPRAHRRTKAELEAEHRSVAEALLALGDLADMAGDFLDDDEENIDDEIDTLRRQRQAADQGSDECRVPSANADDLNLNADARLSWSSGAAAARGVPTVDADSPRGVSSTMLPSVVLDRHFHPLHDTKDAMTMNHHRPAHHDDTMHVFEWLAKLQQQQQHAMESSSTTDGNDAMTSTHQHHHHVLHQLHNNNNPYAMVQMAAMSGNPHAAVMIMQALMATQNTSGVSPDAFQKVMHDAMMQLQQQQQMLQQQQQQQQHPHLSMMQHMLQGHGAHAGNNNGQVTTISPLPVAPPLFGSGSGDGTAVASR